MNEALIGAREVYRECWREARMRIVGIVNGKRVDLIADQVDIVFIAEAHSSIQGVFWIALNYQFETCRLLGISIL